MNTEKNFVKTEINTFENEISGDYILPDSFSDVKNVLGVSGRIKGIKKYFGANDAEISGTVVYDIMFSTLDPEGVEQICSVSFNDDIKYNCRYKAGQNIGVGAQVKLRDTLCRMANPRKFSIKSVFQTFLFEDISISAYPSISSSLAEANELEYLWGECEVVRCRSVNMCEHSFSDNIELDLKSPEIDKIIHSQAMINVRDVRGKDINQSILKLSGTLNINLVYSDKEGDNHSVSKEVCFGISVNDDELAMIGEIDQNTLIMPTVYISELNINVGKNGYGEDKMIEFDADYDIDLLMISSLKQECVIDAYSVCYESECKYEGISYLMPVNRIRNNFTYSDTREKREFGIDSAFLFATSAPTLVEINAEKSGRDIILSGKINNRITLLDEENKYKSKELLSTFTYKPGTDIGEDDLMLAGGTVIENNRVRADNERVYSDAEIYLDYVINSKKSLRICKSVTLGEKKRSKNENEMFCIYYPEENETLWDIAKQKMCKEESILKLNPGADISLCEALIIE